MGDQPCSDSTWFIQPLIDVNAADFVRLRGLNPAFYCGLLHSAAAAEIERQTTVDADLLSVANSAEWSLLMLAPDADEQLDLHALSAPNFLNCLDAHYQQNLVAQSPVCEKTGVVLPFASGWQLYLGYELAGQIEHVLAPMLRPATGAVIAQARRVRGALLFNHLLNQAWCCLESKAIDSFEKITNDLQAIEKQTKNASEIAVHVQEDAASQFLEGVKHTQRYIHDGDVFQVNLSRAWRLTAAADLASKDIYERLIERNPAPFSAWLSVAGEQGFELISSSPERLVALSADEGGTWVDTRPIAGTRPRMPAQAHNDRYLQELRQSPKENAEHLMLIDLERNDLGRVCKPGSIEVNELMSIESFAHVHHIVSNVRGRKRDGVTIGEVIAAVFPGGTITGCPKVRCMQIIAELEGCERGAYTGAVGYLGLDGQMDLNIVIRSLLRPHKNPSELILRAGAGIVADSNPDHELQETRAKANSVLRAFLVTETRT